MSRAPRWFAAIVIAGTFVIGFTTAATAATQVVGALTATSHAPHAQGRAKLTLKTASKGRFQVGTRRLAPHASFDLVVGGVRIGTFTTNAVGRGKVKLSTNPRRGEHLLGVDPRGKRVEVRDDQGDDDLDGDMPGDGDSSGGAFACCTADDDGSECEVETPDECASAGGLSIAGVQSCVPDPCASTPPGEDVVCCLNGSTTGAFVDDDSEVECEETSSAECGMAGGTVIPATSCEGNPCAPVPPHVTPCCVPADEETECEMLTSDHCAALHGTPADAMSCESHPCGGGSGGGDGGGDGQGGDHGGSGGDDGGHDD